MASQQKRTRTYKVLRRKWPRIARKATWWLMGFELAALVPLLVIFGLAQPDLYRTTFWQIGFDNKLNSDPNMILYAYANFRPLPTVPLVWSSTLTYYNVAISVVSLFFLLAKLIGFIMNVWYPIFGLGVNIGIAAVYSVSVYGQIGPDYADPRYPAPAAWYFRFGCGLAKRYGKYSDCQIAQASLGITLYMLVLYLANAGFCAYVMWPNPINDEEEEEDEFPKPTVRQPSPSGMSTVELQGMQAMQNSHNMYSMYNMQSMQSMQGLKSPVSMNAQPLKSPVSVNAQPFTPRSPFTPRAQAFHTLDRQALPPQSARYG